MRPFFQRAFEAAGIYAVQEISKTPVDFQPCQNLPRRHHQFEQCRECRDPVGDEIEMIGNVVYGEAVIVLFRAMSCQLIGAVGEPVVVMACMVVANEMPEGEFDSP
ncbi:hypothetical protein D3C80_161890 [compost metagenome]